MWLWDLGFRVKGLWFWDLGFEVWGLGFLVAGLGFSVCIGGGGGVLGLGAWIKWFGGLRSNGFGVGCRILRSSRVYGCKVLQFCVNPQTRRMFRV